MEQIDETVGTKNVDIKKSFNEFLASDMANQKEFDRRMTKAMDTILETTKKSWQQDKEYLQTLIDMQAQDIEQLVNENKSLKLKEKAIEIAKNKNMDLALLNLLDFSNMSKDELEVKIDWIVNYFTKQKNNDSKNKLSEEISEADNDSNLSDDIISKYFINIGDKKFKIASIEINWEDVELIKERL